MIIVSGEITIDPVDRAKALEAAEAVTAPTLEEDGCASYGIWAHPSEEGRFRVFEEWASEDALVRHFGQPHLAAFMEAMGDLKVISSDIQQYEVSDKRPLGT